MSTLEYIKNKFSITDVGQKTIIPNYGRNDMANLFKELAFVRGAEVGTEKGVFARILLEANPLMKLYCIDPWEKTEDYLEERRNGLHQRNYEQAVEKTKDFDCELIRKPSLEGVKDFENNSLDFVYIDGDHSLPGVINDIHQWQKKVKVGGIIAGHDYSILNHHGKPNLTHHVVDAVDTYTKVYNINPWFLLGRDEEIQGEVRDKNRTFLWIKESQYSPLI